MEKRDKITVTGWNVYVGRAARDLYEIVEGVRDKELARSIARVADELTYVHDDLEDTLARL